jgi:hypothetical protein
MIGEPLDSIKTQQKGGSHETLEQRRWNFMKQIVFVMVSLFFVVSMPLVGAAGDVNITIGVPPPLEFAEPPDVVVVPSGTAYVYMVPDTPGLYFYNDYWYRFHGDRWYRSSIYSGPWVYIETHRVPRFIVDVPPDYYGHLPSGYHRIHYGDLHRHWRTWDKRRHWNRYDWYKREFREHERRHHGDLHRPPHDGHKPPHHDGGGLKHDGGGLKHDGGGLKRDGGGLKQKEGQKTHPDDRREMERGR